MAQEYSLQSFIRDLDDITRNQNSPAAIVVAAKPLLAKLVQRLVLTLQPWSGDPGMPPKRITTTRGVWSAW